MATPDFIISACNVRIWENKTQQVAPRQIDMLHCSDDGQISINELYKQCGSEKPTRFNYIVCYYSSPAIDYLAIKDSPDEKKIVDDCLNQWQFYCVHNSSFRDDEDILQADNPLFVKEATCCCSQYIEHRYYFRNTVNSNILRFGSECIKKMAGGTRMYDEYCLVKKIIRPCKKCLKNTLCFDIRDNQCLDCYQGDPNGECKRVCLSCLKLRITKYGQCKKCWQEGKRRYNIVTDDMVKTCQQCYESFYAKEDWKKLCLNCYKPNGKSRVCLDCYQHFSADEDWKKICPTCYKKKLTSCTKCHKMFAKKVIWQKMCYSCWKEDQQDSGESSPDSGK